MSDIRIELVGNKKCITALFLVIIHVLSLGIAQPATSNSRAPIDTLLVPATEKWLLPVLAPIAAKIAQEQEDKLPYLLVYNTLLDDKHEQLLTQINSQKCLTINTNKNVNSSEKLSSLQIVTQVIDTRPDEFALKLVKEYMGNSENIVIAMMDDTLSTILGSTLAAHLKIPFIPVQSGGFYYNFKQDINLLGVKHIFIAAQDPRRLIRWTDSLCIDYDVLDIEGLEKRIVAALNPSKIKNIILSRIPSYQYKIGGICWLAPYLSLHHGSPVIMVNNSDGIEAEDKVLDFLERHNLYTRSLTILADFESIDMISVSNDIMEEYEVSVEPCSQPSDKYAAMMAVGRFPFSDLIAATQVSARTLFKIQTENKSSFRMLMVANPNTEYGPLPLAETVSRATAEEFKNFHVAVDEFYGALANDALIRQATQNTDLIVFEGHITDQNMFHDPYSYPENPEEEYWERMPPEEEEDPTTPQHYFSYSPSKLIQDENIHFCIYNDPEWSETDMDQNPDGTFTLPLPKHDAFDGCDNSPQDFGAVEKPIDITLEKFPVIILQSCHSLEEDTAAEMFNMGAVAILGSVSNMHSASGSTFVKAFCDALLYRRTTIGEALRDARNYYFCLGNFKTKRGHTQQAKVYRAAFGFFLWGDPELNITATIKRTPQRKPVTASFLSHGQVQICLPQRRLPVSQTEKYQTRIYPGSQLAGIVERLKEKEYRRLMPLYFFKLPVPENFPFDRYNDIQRTGDKSSRAIFLPDPAAGYIYVLYFPHKEKSNDSFTLQFIQNPDSEDLDSSPDPNNADFGIPILSSSKP